MEDLREILIRLQRLETNIDILIIDVIDMIQGNNIEHIGEDTEISNDIKNLLVKIEKEMRKND